MDEGDVGIDIVEELRGRARTPVNVLRIIWYEFSGGVGPWGALRPLIAIGLALVPFLFLGQHFNRQHAKARDWTLLQVPLLLSILLWPLLYIYSIVDAWWLANERAAEATKTATV